MKKLYVPLLLAIFTFSNGTVQGQQYNETPQFLRANSKWIMGGNAGWDKTTNLRINGITGFTSDGSASIADPETGALLFYTNGDKIWDKNLTVMPNGTGLGGGGRTQTVCVVPFIDEAGKYYIFTQNDPFRNTGMIPPLNETKLFYSVLDMSLNGGMGDIAVGQKTIALDSGMSSSMIAIPDEGCGIWLMTHALREPVFKAFHITREGLESSPVMSAAGPTPYAQGVGTNGEKFQKYEQGQLSVSPDRKMIAIATTSQNGSDGSIPYSLGTVLCKFNARTGRVSDAITINQGKQHAYGLAFSPDNTKLYTMVTSAPLPFVYGLYQYDVSKFDSTSVKTSETQIYAPSNSLNWCMMKLYNDTIYLSQQGTPSPTGLSIIANPNASGAACNFQFMAISYVGTVYQGLPNDIVYPLKSQDTLTGIAMDTLICKSFSSMELLPQINESYFKYEWDNGSISAKRKIYENGTYWVKYNDECQYYIDTFMITGAEVDPIISIDIDKLSTTLPYHTYQWYVDNDIITNATEREYTVMKNGDYKVLVSNEIGCFDTSAVYKVTNMDKTFIGNITSNKIKVYPNPANDYITIETPFRVDISITSVEGKVLSQVKDAQRISLKSFAKGFYWLRIIDENGQLIQVMKLVKE